MKKKVTVLLLVAMLLAVTVPVIGAPITMEQDALEKESTSVETTEVVITLHSLKGRENIHLELPVDELERLGTSPEMEEILALLPETERQEIEQRFNADKQNLLKFGEKTSLFSKRQRVFNSIGNIMPVNESWVNYLCTVKGVGLLLLFPPFLPITPLLYAGLLIINCNGTEGSINKAVENAIMVPFIGLSVWWVQAYVFAGVAGVCYCWNTDE